MVGINKKTKTCFYCGTDIAQKEPNLFAGKWICNECRKNISTASEEGEEGMKLPTFEDMPLQERQKELHNLLPLFIAISATVAAFCIDRRLGSVVFLFTLAVGISIYIRKGSS